MAGKKELVNINKLITDMISNLNGLEKQFTETGQVIGKGAAEFDAQAKRALAAQEKKNAADKAQREEIAKEQKAASALLKAQTELSDAYKNNAIDILKLKKIKADMVKTQKLELQAGQGQIKTYDQLAARYNLAAKKARDLSAQYGVNSDKAREAVKTAKEYNDNLKGVDESLGNHQRNVGNYNDKLGDMKEALAGASGGIGGLIGGFETFIKNPYVAIFGAIAGAVAGMASIMNSSRSGSALLSKGMLEVSSRSTVLKSKLREATEEFADGSDKMKAFNKILIVLNGGHDISANLAGKTTDVYKEQIDVVKQLSKELIDLNNAYIDIENELLVQIVTQKGLAEAQMIIADDATRSIQDRRKAAQEAFKLDEQAGKASLLLANERLGIAEAEIEIGIKAGELVREQDGTIRSLSKDAIELEKAYTDASVAAIEASNNLTNARLNNQKRLADINQADFEQNLDFILDIADTEKTINEQKIADSKRTLAEREGILADTKTLMTESYQDQLDLFKNELGINLDRSKILKLNNKEIFEYARGLELSEIATNRLREVIMERRKAVQDLATAEADLNAERLAAIDKYTSEIEKYNDDQLAVIEAGIVDDRKLVEESISRKEKLRLDADKKEIEDAEKKKEQLVSAAQQTGALVLDVLTMFADQRLELADRALEEETLATDAAERNLDRQIALAEAGHANDVSGAQKALDLQKATQQKALEEKKRALEQKQKLETIEQGISVITSVANIIQGFSSIPVVGWVLGIAAGAAMIAAFATQKRQAKAATQSFGEGGEINLEGGSHASGNDIHFGNKDGVELRAEGGEKAAIFNKKATQRYGREISSFIRDANRLQLEDRGVNAFNLGALPIYVENNSNFDSRETNNLLKRLISQGSTSNVFDPIKNRQVIKKGNQTIIING